MGNQTDFYIQVLFTGFTSGWVLSMDYNNRGRFFLSFRSKVPYIIKIHQVESHRRLVSAVKDTLFTAHGYSVPLLNNRVVVLTGQRNAPLSFPGGICIVYVPWQDPSGRFFFKKN